jgi:AraC-like DNA-binding protein
VAKACAVSESGLRQLFHKQLGLSPAQYRTQIKIKRAMYLLQATNLSIREISDQLNFFDTAYFYKVFKAHTGMTPAQYAKTKSL